MTRKIIFVINGSGPKVVRCVGSVGSVISARDAPDRVSRPGLTEEGRKFSPRNNTGGGGAWWW